VPVSFSNIPESIRGAIYCCFPAASCAIPAVKIIKIARKIKKSIDEVV
jgi:hypothetical protein